MKEKKPYRGQHVHMFKQNQHLNIGMWVYGYLSSDHHINSEELGGDMLVHPETIGRSTGLPDKNGTIIYEGDIHQWGEKKGVVYFDTNLLIVNVCKYTKSGGPGLPIYQLQFDTAQWGEVLGNVFDDPEILDPSKAQICPDCEGTGIVKEYSPRSWNHEHHEEVTCPRCDGTGEISEGDTHE